MYRGRKSILRLLGFAAVMVLWESASRIRASPALPPLNRILRTLFYLIRDGTYTEHIAASLNIILLGIGSAVAVGFTLGLLLFRYEGFRTAALLVIECVRGIAALTLFPLMIVLVGMGTLSRVIVIFWTAWPAVVLSTVQGMEVDNAVVDAARTSGAGDWRIIFSVRIPMAAQGIITGIRIGVSGGWIGLIAAEMLGATKGLGYFLLWSAQSFEFEKVYATIFVIAAIGGVMNAVLMIVQKKANQITGGYA